MAGDGSDAAMDPGSHRESRRRSAPALSVQVGFDRPTAIALVLGSLLAAAVHRYRFFGLASRLLAILPVALPGIVTGIALNTTFRTLFGGLSLFTLIVGHATFCVVTVYNNVIARMRSTSASLVEASADLGADPLQTFRFVTLPVIRSALIAGAPSAFALSFDQIIVTTFTAGSNETLPIWIFANLSRPNQLPDRQCGGAWRDHRLRNSRSHLAERGRIRRRGVSAEGSARLGA